MVRCAKHGGRFHFIFGKWASAAGAAIAAKKGEAQAAAMRLGVHMSPAGNGFAGGYFLLHQTMVTPMHTTAMPIQRLRLIRSPRKAFAPKAPAA